MSSAADISIVEMKPQLRRQVQAALKSLPMAQVERESAIIQQKILQSGLYQRSRRVAVYLNLSKEVHTKAIVEDLVRHNNMSKICFIPDLVPDSQNPGESVMHMVKLYSMDDLATFAPSAKSLGVLSPQSTHKQRDDAFDVGLDLVLLPGLAFDPKCNRLGRGKAYYDHFIRDLRKRCAERSEPMPRLVGLCLAAQLVPEIPMEPHDQQLDAVVTADANYGTLTLD